MGLFSVILQSALFGLGLRLVRGNVSDTAEELNDCFSVTVPGSLEVMSKKCTFSLFAMVSVCLSYQGNLMLLLEMC